MPRAGHDWVCLIRIALPVAAWMDMYVGYNSETARAADFPKARQGRLSNNDNSGRQSRGVDVVVKNELENIFAAIAPGATEQVSAALTPPVERTPRQFRDAGLPNPAAASKPRRRFAKPAKQPVQKRGHEGVP